MTRRSLVHPLSLTILAGLALGLSSPSTELNLRPRFEEGQKLTIEQSLEMDGVLDSISVVVDGGEVLGDGVDIEMEISGRTSYVEEIVELRDGEIATMRLTVDEQSGSIVGELDAMGNADSIDEPIETSLEGHTFEIVVDEDGEAEITDVTEGESSADDAEMNALTHENHFEHFLPEDPVEEGEPFELADDWIEMAQEMLDGDLFSETEDMSSEELAAMESLMEAVFNGTELEAKGTVSDVEEGVATIDYELSGFMSVDDLISIFADALPPEIGGDIPPGVEAVIEANFEMEGVGRFDLELGQMVELGFKGSYEIILSGSADVEGTSAEAEATFTGEFTIAATIEAE